MINELEYKLKQALGWRKPRIQCLVQIILGLITVRSVNLKELACYLSGQAQIDSNYRRLQRFFVQIEFPRHVVARLIAGLFFCPRNPFTYPWIERIGNGVNRTLTYWCSAHAIKGLPYLSIGWRSIKREIQIPRSA